MKGKRDPGNQMLERQRWLRRDRSLPQLPPGLSARGWHDLYHSALAMPGWLLFLALAIAYFAANLLFAWLYWLDPAGIANARPEAFGDYFFFSVQTMATIGYGLMAPQSTYANILVTIEALLGLTGFALAAALMFARFSRPTARVLFSDVAVIAPHDGVPTLMFRVANQRRNRIQEARIRLDLVRDEVSSEGVRMRRFYELPLVRARNPVFSLSWMVMHRLVEDSPLLVLQRDFDGYLELIVTFSGIDESFAQPVTARHSFLAPEILFGHRFVDIVIERPGGERSFDYGRFHKVERIG